MPFAVEFDFEQKQERSLGLGGVAAARAAGRYCWVDFCGEQQIERLAEFLDELAVEPQAIEEILELEPRPGFNVYPNCLHCSLAEARLIDGDFRVIPVHVVLGDGFLVTIHRDEAEFVRRARQTYREGFRTAALSPGYLLFELADHLAHVLAATLSHFSEEIEQLEGELFGDIDDVIFPRVSELIRSLLQYRKMVIGCREVVHELATRRSPFVAETTQPYLDKKAALLERLGTDATTEREVLSEILALYMGIISHRTNAVVTRLTVISAIFMPLAFLTGVFGMNFDPNASPFNMPELRSPYGYIGFWIFAGLLVLVLIGIMKRLKWL